MGYMKQLADQLAHANTPIKNIRIGKDSLTNTSRGVCYVEMNSVVDAMFLHNQLLGKLFCTTVCFVYTLGLLALYLPNHTVVIR